MSFIRDHVADGAKVCTDDAVACSGMPFDSEPVKHGMGGYVRGMAYTNGVESLGLMLERGDIGIDHQMIAKHLHWYVSGFAGRHGVRERNTVEQLRDVAARMAGKRLPYCERVRF